MQCVVLTAAGHPGAGRDVVHRRAILLDVLQVVVVAVEVVGLVLLEQRAELRHLGC